MRSMTTYPVAFSNMPRALSVIFSFIPRCLTGSILPWPNFFSAKSRPVMEVMLAGSTLLPSSQIFERWDGHEGR